VGKEERKIERNVNDCDGYTLYWKCAKCGHQNEVDGITDYHYNIEGKFKHHADCSNDDCDEEVTIYVEGRKVYKTTNIQYERRTK
jgi:hypothetical protein